MALLVLVSVLAPWISPDATPYADRQIPEAALVNPGTRVQCLPLEPIPGAGEVWVPVDSFFLANDSLYYYPRNSFRQLASPATVLKNATPVTVTYWAGSDVFGRDFLSRMFWGGRVSLLAGLVSVCIALSVGVLFGVFAGFYGGWVDSAISWFMNVVWSIPTVLFVLAIALVLGNGLFPIYIGIGLTMWVDVARVVRGQFLAFRKQEFTEAARAMGLRDIRIIFRHILPNCSGPIWIIAISNFAAAILIESGLSFLGLGAGPPIPSWGNLIESNRQYLLTGMYHLAILPGLAIMSLVLAVTLIGQHYRNTTR